MGVAADAPALDIAYKLVENAGQGRLKLSSGKQILPGRKQVYRVYREGLADHDVVTRDGEEGEGEPLLKTVMRDGTLMEPEPSLDRVRAHAKRSMAVLPEPIRRIEPADPPYDVHISAALDTERRRVADHVRRANNLSTIRNPDRHHQPIDTHS